MPIGRMLSDESPPAFPGIASSNAGTQLSMGRFVGRVLIVAGLVLLTVLVVHLRSVLVLVFGCVLVAVALHGGASLLQRLTGVGPQAALVGMLFGLMLIIGVGTWLLGAPIAAEFDAVRVALPKGLEAITRWLESNPPGQWLLQWWRQTDATPEWSRVAGWFGTVLGAFGSVVLMLVAGIYLAADPRLYRRGVLHLVPPRQRARVARALSDAGNALLRWLMGQGVAMIIVGLLTTGALMLIGMPLALPLGAIAGALEFVPYFGPLASGALIVLLAFTQGEMQALYAALACLAVQQMEGYLVQPFVQRWAIALPPALGLISVIVFGATFGPLGVAFAVPLTVVLMRLVQRLYVQEALGDVSVAPPPGAVPLVPKAERDAAAEAAASEPAPQVAPPAPTPARPRAAPRSGDAGISPAAVT